MILLSLLPPLLVVTLLLLLLPTHTQKQDQINPLSIIRPNLFADGHNYLISSIRTGSGGSSRVEAPTRLRCSLTRLPSSRMSSLPPGSLNVAVVAASCWSLTRNRYVQPSCDLTIQCR